MPYQFDAVVVGSGPNGLAAAITLQQCGLKVKIIEGRKTCGGGMRSAYLTLPNFVNDICSAIHPMAAYSPFFKTLPLRNHGLNWIYPEFALAHPFGNGHAAVLEKSIEKTAESLKTDSKAYVSLFEPLVKKWDNIGADLLAPLRLPEHPFDFVRFGLYAMTSAKYFAKSNFKYEYAQGFFAGLAAHSIRPLNKSFTSAIGLVLAIVGHHTGWPLPQGGTQKLADALVSYFLSIGGTIETDHFVKDYKELEYARIKLFDITPKQILNIAHIKFPKLYEYQLKKFRYGPGIFKIDYALREPIPFKAKDCGKAGTVHIGGSFEEISRSESETWKGKHPDKPYILLSQPSMFDRSRAPEDKHTAWAYCHVPPCSEIDMTKVMEDQIEVYAPGFKDIILERHTLNSKQMQDYNPNYIGGDINGGIADFRQLFTRPAIRISSYTTPIKDLYICSSSTPPGGGVHGMCGYHSAKRALADHFNIKLKS